MFVKDSILRLVVIFLALVFGASVFFGIRFLRREVLKATSPSAATLSAGGGEFNMKAYEAVAKHLQIQ